MVQIITSEMHATHKDALEQIYRLRATVIERWGWNVPGFQAGRDKDQFDTAETVYFLDTDQDTGEAVGTARFNPTTAPHLLSEIFPHMCEFNGVPQASDTWEATRYMIDTKGFPDWQSKRSRSRLALALNEYALVNGISKMSWLSTIPLYRNMKNLWPTLPLGAPLHHEDDDNVYIAAISEMTEEASAKLRGVLQAFPGADAMGEARQYA